MYEQLVEEPMLFHLPGSTDLVPFSQLPIGAMWFEHFGASDQPELCVMLPSRTEWNIDRGRLAYADNPKVPKWSRSGEPPFVSVAPSINHVGKYHGFLGSNGSPPGVLSDDIEGRTFA